MAASLIAGASGNDCSGACSGAGNACTLGGMGRTVDLYVAMIESGEENTV